ncbi:MAG: dienelactone hydrolase family protein [Cyclobacteriaceae bacterium]|nr:dienelactone hydrolase family protein [Cyclobacteriaceae bacterium]
MKQRIYTTRHYRLLDISLIILLMLANCINITAQEFHSQIEANHRVYIPQGKEPFPVIIAIPGCSGVSLNGPETDAGRPGDEGDRLFRRHYPRMAEKLQEAGFLVLLIDYLTAEGVLNTCGWEIHPKRVGEYIKEAISFVKTIPTSDTSRINVIGWSHGGAGVLAWLSNLEVEPIGVQSAVAVYPGCNASGPWDSTLPVLMILGEADDITPISVCNDLIQSLSKQTNVQVKSYLGARHGFDLTEGPTVLSVGNGLTVGRNPKAGNDAWKEILSFLNKN